jgi:serine O-acetyltransferase
MSKKELVRGVLAAVIGIRCLPHLLLVFQGKSGALVRSDVVQWRGGLGRTGTWYGLAFEFLYLMLHSPEFRNLFYNRTGFKGKLYSFLCPPMDSLYLHTKDIGPGLYIQHGFATIVSARKIGANCWINQQVTVGYSDGTDRPTLGDNVKIMSGAKVIGNVTIGDNSTVGANAVVVKDVPPNCTVVGVPAYIVRRDGVRTHENL